MSVVSAVGVNLQPHDRGHILAAIEEINVWLAQHQGPWRFQHSIIGVSITGISDGDDSAWTECWRWKREQLPTARALFLVRGAGGYAGGSQEARMGIVSDGCLDGLSGDLGGCQRLFGRHLHGCIRHQQLGAMGHETCHVMGFRHEDGGLAGAEYVQFPRVRGPWEPTRKGCLWPF